MNKFSYVKVHKANNLGLIKSDGFINDKKLALAVATTMTLCSLSVSVLAKDNDVIALQKVAMEVILKTAIS